MSRIEDADTFVPGPLETEEDGQLFRCPGCGQRREQYLIYSYQAYQDPQNPELGSYIWSGLHSLCAECLARTGWVPCPSCTEALDAYTLTAPVDWRETEAYHRGNFQCPMDRARREREHRENYLEPLSQRRPHRRRHFF